jgi:hypothetical protein
MAHQNRREKVVSIMSRIEELMKDVRGKSPEISDFLGISLDFDKPSLLGIDRFIIRRDWSKESIPEELEIYFGLYFGEVIRKELKGSDWKDQTENLFDASLTIPFRHEGSEASMEIYPFRRINKFLGNHEDGLYPGFCFAEDIYNGRGTFLEGEDKKVSTSSDIYQATSTSMKIPPDLKKKRDAGEISQNEMVKIMSRRASRGD